MTENKKNQDYKTFLDVLSSAGKKIRYHFFRIQTASEEGFVFRERVYCYELYHRLREMLPLEFNYELDGELDKKGQKLFHKLKMKYIPDFLVHKPGDMDHNLTVIEVKQIRRYNIKKKEISSDIAKLSRFIEEASYFRGIMLLYSDDLNEFPQKLKNFIKDQIENSNGQIQVLFHPGPTKKIEKIEI